MKPSAARIAVAVGVAAALAVVRTRGVSENFWLLGEQIRDWTIALGSWRDLPLSGTPSSVGGRTLGPIYYWLLWIIRHGVGPLTGNMPHAGAIGLSILQSIADGVLLLAIWRRFESATLAIAAVLLWSTQPVDLSLTATIWNPPIAVAFVKLAIAITLCAGASIWWAVAATAASWLAVQAHSSAMVVAAPIMIAFVARELIARQWTRALQTARAIVETVVVLQIPFLMDRVLHPSVAPVGPTGFVNYLGPVRLIDNAGAVLSNLEMSAGSLNLIPWRLLLLAAAGAGVVMTRRDPPLAAVTWGPIAFVLVQFAAFDNTMQSYWFLTVVPSAVLTLVLALHGIRPRPLARAASVGFLIVVGIAVPARIAQGLSMGRWPSYGALVKGSLTIRHSTDQVFQINPDFDLPPTGEGDFIYTTVLGGRIVPTAPYVATILSDGSVTYRPAPHP